MAGVAAATWQVAGELERAPGDRARALCLSRRGPSPGTEPARCGAGGPSPAPGSGRGARSAVHPRASRWPRAGLACRELLGKLFASLLSAAGLPSPGKCLKLQARKFGEPLAGRPGPAAVSLTCVAVSLPNRPTPARCPVTPVTHLIAWAPKRWRWPPLTSVHPRDRLRGCLGVGRYDPVSFRPTFGEVAGWRTF